MRGEMKNQVLVRQRQSLFRPRRQNQRRGRRADGPARVGTRGGGRAFAGGWLVRPGGPDRHRFRRKKMIHHRRQAPTAATRHSPRMMMDLRSMKMSRLTQFNVPPLKLPRRRRKVFPGIAPGMAAAKPPRSQPAAPDRAVEADGLARVLRATRREAAAARRPQSRRQRRRKRQLINANDKNQNPLRNVHGRSCSSRAWRKTRKKSRFHLRQLLARDGGPRHQNQIHRAAPNHADAGGNSRATAAAPGCAPRRRRSSCSSPPPGGWLAGGRGSTLAMRQPHDQRRPCALARAKSPCNLQAAGTGKRKRAVGGPAMAQLNRGKAFPADAAAIAQNSASALAGIAV